MAVSSSDVWDDSDQFQPSDSAVTESKADL
jgi:hypothetical protein